jgi:hypothetical protein
MLKFSLQFCCEREGAQSVSCEPQISRQRGCYRAIMVERLIVYAGLPPGKQTQTLQGNTSSNFLA